MIGSTSWDALGEELARWQGDGRVATFWWRDDDAARPDPALDRLLALRAEIGAPLALAVIPAAAEPALAATIDEAVAVLQHGFAHRNHAGDRKCELDAARGVDVVLAELSAGREHLATLFPRSALPVVVPPWNRISESLLDHLPDIGFRGLSTYGARPGARPAPGLTQINTHVDIIDWRGTRGYVGDEAALGLALDHLAARRRGDADEPTGLLSHHLAHDAGAWRFLGRFGEAVAAHPAARWVAAGDAFRCSPRTHAAA